MPCPSCGFENPPENKFCGECGAELVLVCPSCSTPNPPSSKFCGECGSALRSGDDPARTATPVRAEQRLVSVLFADLVGFTPFSESRDSEEVRDLLTTYFDRSRAIVERFGGSVDKFIGDAVMAVWGATGAQEDDAERAVRAAIELVDMVAALGSEIGVPDLSLRAGVTTGETSVGPGGNEKGLVVGDLVNTASRLQSIAESGSVFVGETTYRLTAASIQYRSLGPQSVKGKDEPVAAFCALRVTGEVGGGRQGEGLEAPFTGRDVEFRLLKDQLHATAADGSARLVSVIGEAGIGKTRLAWELEKYVDGLADVVYWHRGRSPSYGDGLAMWALGEMVRSRAGITETEEASKARLKLRTAVAEYVPSGEDRSWLEPRLAALLGLDDAPVGDRDELYAAIRTFFHHIADRGITALVFEDMHWADPGLLDFVAELVERSPRHPILVVTLARPDLLDARPGWGSGRSNFLSVHLGPLGDAAMMTLVSGMVPGIPDEVVSAVVDRAGGIPLYAVEFVRMLVGSGELEESDGSYRLIGDVAGLALPDSLQAVIGARIDRMAPVDRNLLQDAAVLGQSFTIEGLAAMRDTDVETVRPELDRLVQHHVLEIDDDPRSPERGQYLFVQGLIREVAYGRLSKTDRHHRHLRVAEYFEGLTDNPELVGAVASHYLAAADAAPDEEAAHLLERGRTALSEAAARAGSLQSHEASLALYVQALELSPEPAERARLLEEASRVAVWGSQYDRSVELAAESVVQYDEVGDEEGRLRAIRLQAFTLNSVFRADEGVALLAPEYESIDDPQTHEEVALALETARGYMLDRQYEESVEILERVLGRAEMMLPVADVVDGLITKGTALVGLRRIQEAIALLSGAVTLADENQLQAQAIRALNNLGVVQAYDAPRLGQARAADILGRSRRFGALVWVGRALTEAASVTASEGELDDALALLEEAAEMTLSDLDLSLIGFVRAYIGAVRGESAALETGKATAAAYEDSTDAQMIGYVASMRAAMAWVEGDYATTFEQSLLDETPTGIVSATLAAMALCDRELMERAVEFAEEHGLPGRLNRAVARLGDAVYAVLDNAPGAGDALAAAVETWEPIADSTGYAMLRVLACRLRPEHPALVEAGISGLAWLRGAGMTALADRASDWVPEEPTQAASA